MKNYKVDTDIAMQCYHCGESCKEEPVLFDEKIFCCEGCKLVYDLLKENNLCTYYKLSDKPGISPDKTTYNKKFEYLDNEAVQKKLIRFKNENESHIQFFIPKMHCSSCIWLLENLHKIKPGINSSEVNFLRKEVNIIFNSELVKISDIANLLTHIGYEPLINLENIEGKKEKKTNKEQIIKIGIAGFCFGNIMMLSFPEYFASGNFQDQKSLKVFFGYLNLFLSLPVFFYSASEFFISAWNSIRYRFLNIDAPIALAILVTFLRSVYEITSQTAAGYMDSMCGIVFFMLIGRYFQNKTYDTLSFDRDYKSFFPLGVTLKKDNETEENIPVTKLKKGDKIIIRSNEIIPSDSILISSSTHIDYAFITGESKPVKKVSGDILYAGGKQLDGAVEMEIINPTSHSYLTQLWNKNLQPKDNEVKRKTFIDNINMYFTITVLSIAFLSAAYWGFYDTTKALNALTAVLIVACPCGLLLTSTFANGNVMRVFGRNKFYLKNASVIERISGIDTVIFDKTGTITQGSTLTYSGKDLSMYEKQIIAKLAFQSSHPLSRKISTYFSGNNKCKLSDFEEYPGKGIKGNVDGKYVLLGSEEFICGSKKVSTEKTCVFIAIDGVVLGYFNFNSEYRNGLKNIIFQLSETYNIELLSGDNDSEKDTLKHYFSNKSSLLFNQKPDQKMNHVQALQQKSNKVMMLGDGLNDAGALLQSDVGIAVSDDTNSFSPACDAIIDGSAFAKLPQLLKLANDSKKAILFTFSISLTYNIIGLLFAIQGTLSPIIAAILMPLSSISIVLLSTLSTNVLAKTKGL